MDLKALREYKLRQSRAEFAQHIGVSEADVALWEEGSPSVEVIEKIAQKTGLDFNMILGYKKPVVEAIIPEDTWKDVESTKSSLIHYITELLQQAHVTENQKKAYIDGLQQCIDCNSDKPRVVIAGRSDTGKSTMINTLLGAESMPAAWTPTTAIAVYIKHIADRPAFMQENAWVFANQAGEETLWDVNRLHDEEYCKAWRIAAGDVDILQTYGIRQDQGHAFEAGSAVVFVDAPILRDCDIIDIPGFGTETESDDWITLKVTQSADVIIYLSQANGFMRIEDITYLKENIQSLSTWERKGDNELKPLANLFIVASQAHTVNHGDRAQLENILKTGCENLTKTLSERYWARREEVSGYSKDDYEKDALPSRFFTYTTDIPDLCEAFNAEIRAVLQALPVIIHERTKAAVKKYVETHRPRLAAEISQYEHIEQERDKYAAMLEEIEKNELSRIEKNDRQKSIIFDGIEKLRIESEQEFRAFFSEMVNTDAIIKQLKDEKIKNTKEDVELFASKFQSTVQDEVKEILRRKNHALTLIIREYIKNYSKEVNYTYSDDSFGVNFDAAWAFTSALSKIGILGGSGALVSGIAALFFLPIPVLIGVGGDVAVAALAFGPVGLAAGLAIGGALGVVKLFGGGWEKSVAKQMTKAFENNNIQEKYISAIRSCWKETTQEFISAVQGLEEEWQNHIEIIRKVVHEYDDQELEEQLYSLRELLKFFDRLPVIMGLDTETPDGGINDDDTV